MNPLCPQQISTQTVQSGGGAIKVFLYGSQGPFLVLLHGNGEDHTIFANQIGAFMAHFRVIAIDKPLPWGVLLCFAA